MLADVVHPHSIRKVRRRNRDRQTNRTVMEEEINELK
jgi:hypothetical protein